MKKKEMKTFLNIPIKYILASLVAAVVIFWFIYYVFSKTSAIPAGIRLTRSDWLSFIGDYLSFAGTAVVSFIALWQTYHYNKRADQQREEDRWRSIQPVFSVEIGRRNGPIPYSKAPPGTKHKNVLIKIKTVTDHPIKHVVVFGEYKSALMKKDDAPITCYCVFYDSPDAKYKGEGLVLLDGNGGYDRDKNDTPISFEIRYEDMDGNDMFQIFELNSRSEHEYYSLYGTYKLNKEKKPSMQL